MRGPIRAQPPSGVTPQPGPQIAERGRARNAWKAAASTGPRLPGWWPLAALVLVAAVLRLPTLSLQSLWYDEAYTPVHVLHPGLVATLRSVAAHENTPPLWYVLVWAISRALGTGAFALRLLSAIAGIALVAVGWAIGAELDSRRTATALAAILTVNPLFIWYSQEARAYELYALLSAVSLLYFLRARSAPTPGVLALWAASSTLALLTHYFAAFLVAPEAIILLAAVAVPRSAGERGDNTHRELVRVRRATLAAVCVVAVSGAALIPLVLAQAGRGTQWIGQWALSARLVQIPGYYLLGANGSALGHALLILSALPLLGVIVMAGALVRSARLREAQLDALALVSGLGFAAILIPLALALAGADYLAPRNLIADWIPLSAAIAIVLGAASARGAVILAVAVCLAALAVLIATDLDPRLQRADWRAVAVHLRAGTADRAIVTVALGAAPLEYYLPHLRLRYLSRRSSASVREIDLVGYPPLRPGAIHPPTTAFRLIARSDTHGLIAYRYLATTPQLLGGRFLRSLTITAGGTGEALLPDAVAAVQR
jgi:hypothetical protein